MDMNFSPARDYKTVANLRTLLTSDSKVDCAEPIIDALFSKPTIFYLQHNDPTSWIPYVPVWADFMISESHKRNQDFFPFIFYHKALQKVPYFGDLSRWMTGNTVSTYKEMLEIIDTGKPVAFGSCPEGSNCMFDFGSPVGEFQQFGLIKAGLATDADMFIMAFKHGKPFSLKLRSKIMNRFRDGAEALKVPFLRRTSLYTKIVPFTKPMTKEEFNSLTKEQQSMVVAKVSDMMRTQMIELYNTIDISELNS